MYFQPASPGREPPRRPDRRAPHHGGAGGEAGRPPHRPRRARRACRGRPLLRDRRRPASARPLQERDHRRYPRPAIGSARHTNMGQPISHRLDHMLSGVRPPRSRSRSSARTSTPSAPLPRICGGKLAAVPGLVDLQVEKQVRVPQLEVIVDYRRAALYGLSPPPSPSSSNGSPTDARLAHRRRQPPLRRGDAARRHAPDHAGAGRPAHQSPIGWIPVREIAEVVETDGPNQILRENGKRRTVVLANTDGQADMAAVVAEIRRLLAQQRLPQGACSPAWKAPSRRRRSRCGRSGCSASSRSP